MKTILICLATASTLCLNAQYTITTSSNPIVGDVSTTVDTYSTGLTLPVSGTNKLWNYSNLTLNVSSTGSGTYVALSSVPNSSLFPGATIGIAYNANGYDDVYKINSSTNDLLGNSAPTASDCSVFSNPFTTMTLPFAYGSNYMDTFGNTSSSGTFAGTVTVIADGTGTLVLPGYTLTSVLKVSMQFSEIETYTASSTSYTYTGTGVQHLFYSAASKFPLLTVNSSASTVNPGNTTSVDLSATMNANFVLAGIKEFSNESDFSIFPNPVNTKNVEVSFTNKGNSPVKLSLSNMLGQMVKEEKYENQLDGKNKILLDLKNIPTGIYYLQIKTGEYESVKKLVIE